MTPIHALEATLLINIVYEAFQKKSSRFLRAFNCTQKKVFFFIMQFDMSMVMENLNDFFDDFL